MAKRTTESTYQPLTPRLLVQLAAPHTWPASIFPVFLALALACAAKSSQTSNWPYVVILLAISVLFQSAVNTINDYFDFVKGTDTRDNQANPTDAVLVYNRVNPRHVLAFAVVLVLCAFALGVACIIRAGWVPLAIALVGVLVIVLYSGGRTPISYLPLGEAASGITMGALITLASYQVLTLELDWLVLLYSLPLVIGIALIMMTNNGCDIEKDVEAQRRTLPVLLGRQRALAAYHGLVYAWIGGICLLVCLFFTKGWLVLPFMLLAVHPLGRALLANPLNAQSRGAAFAQVTSLNVALGAFYGAAVIMSAV